MGLSSMYALAGVLHAKPLLPPPPPPSITGEDGGASSRSLALLSSDGEVIDTVPIHYDGLWTVHAAMVATATATSVAAQAAGLPVTDSEVL
jgi:hypothetical protein